MKRARAGMLLGLLGGVPLLVAIVPTADAAKPKKRRPKPTVSAAASAVEPAPQPSASASNVAADEAAAAAELAASAQASASSAPEVAPPASTEPPPPPPPPTESAPAVAGVPIGGRVFVHLRGATSDPVTAPFQQVSASAWLELRPRFNDATAARVTVAADAFATSLEGKESVRFQLREAYLVASKSGWELKMGQQIIPWGNADAINPTDVLGAKDFAFFSADAETKRIGSLSVLGGFTPNGGDSPFELKVVVTPVFPQSRIIIPAGVLPPGVVIAGPVRPPVTLENVETAAKVTYSGDGWDVGVMGFRGFNHLPELQLRSQDATGTVVELANRPTLVGGAEASASTGKWVFRLEGAYAHSEDIAKTDPRRTPSRIDGVLGVERGFGERVRVQAQGIVRYIPKRVGTSAFVTADPIETATAQALARANAILLNYTETVRPAATLRIAYTTEDEVFEAEVFTLANFIGLDALVRPMVTVRPSDALRLMAGAELYVGETTTSLGALRGLSGAFLEGRYTF